MLVWDNSTLYDEMQELSCFKDYRTTQSEQQGEPMKVEIELTVQVGNYN